LFSSPTANNHSYLSWPLSPCSVFLYICLPATLWKISGK
jgi:hypothetical protein